MEIEISDFFSFSCHNTIYTTHTPSSVTAMSFGEHANAIILSYNIILNHFFKPHIKLDENACLPSKITFWTEKVTAH